MADDHTELLLYAENDGDLYRKLRVPIERRLTQRMTDGTYDRAGAIAEYLAFVNRAADQYQYEIERRAFPPGTRRAVAIDFVERFEAEHRLGNMQHHAPARTTAQLEREIASALETRDVRRRLARKREGRS